MRIQRNCHCGCVFANCNSTWRTVPKDRSITFIPFARPCSAFIDSEINSLLNKRCEGQKHNTLTCAQCSKALRWMHLSRRGDNGFTKLTDITKGTYVCSKHFVENKPTDINPDPMPANISADEERKRRCAVRRAPCEQRDILAKRQKILPAQVALNELGVYQVCNAVASALDIGIRKDVEVPTSIGNHMVNVVAKPDVWIGIADICQPQSEVTDIHQVSAGDNGTGITSICQIPCEMDMVTFAKGKMHGWATIVTGTHAMFIKYDERTLTGIIEVRVEYAPGLLVCHTSIYGYGLQDGSDLYKEQAQIQTYAQLDKFMVTLENTSVCKGISNAQLVQECKDTRNPTAGKYCYMSNTARSNNCKLLTCGLKCMECLKYEHNLKRLLQHRMQKLNKKPNKCQE